MQALHPRGLGVILSYRCHSRCKHCLYNCGPHWEQEPMSTDALRRALDAVTCWSPMPQVHLTGGEPFHHFPLLLSGVRMAAERGIDCYVETNASWCIDRDLALDRFHKLREAGLGAVLISCSPFHAEFIPPKRTLLAIQAALDIYPPHEVIVYLPEYIELIQRFGVDRPTPLPSYEERFGAGGAQRLLWQGYGLISGGRAGFELGHLTNMRPSQAFQEDRCEYEILYAAHSHFDLYGNYIPWFCGGLTVGSWHVLTHAVEAFRAGRYPDLIAILITEGPFGLMRLASDEHGFEPAEGGYAGKCHLCVDVRRTLVGVENYAELQPRGFYKDLQVSTKTQGRGGA